MNIEAIVNKNVNQTLNDSTIRQQATKLHYDNTKELIVERYKKVSIL